MTRTIRFPDDLYDRLVNLAKADHRSLQSLIIHLLYIAVEAQETRGRDA
jgi:predicted transcriptional regulator